MAMITERIPVLVTKAQKAQIAMNAKAANLTMGEFMRRAVEAYQPGEDHALLEGLVGQVLKTTAHAMQSMEDALAFIAASQQRIDTMEAAHSAKKAA